MHNTKLAESIKQIGHGLVTLGEALAHTDAEIANNNPSAPVPVNTPEPEKKTRAKKADAAPAASPAGTPAQHEGKTASERAAVPGVSGVSMDQVRHALLKVAGDPALGPDKARAVLAKFEAGRLSELKDAQYPAFLKALADLSATADSTAALL